MAYVNYDKWNIEGGKVVLYYKNYEVYRIDLNGLVEDYLDLRSEGENDYNVLKV